MNHFKEASKTWDTPDRIELNQKYAEKIKESLKVTKDLNILEVGCGTGLLSSFFNNGNNKIRGIDTSEDMLAIFKQKFSDDPNMQSQLINLEKADLDQSNFDLIMSSMAFHHLKDPAAVLKKLKKMLSPTGVIAIIDLDEEDGSFHPDPKSMGVHHFGFSKVTLESWAQKNSFHKFSHHIIHTTQKPSGKYPVFLAIFS